MACFITRLMHGVSHQYPIASKNTVKYILWGQPGGWFPHFSKIMGGSLPLDSHPVICFIAWEMHGCFNQFLIIWENAAKSILWQEPGISILLPIYLSFCSNKFPLLYSTFNGWYMCFHTNFLYHLKFSETPLHVRKLEYSYPYFSQDWTVSLLSNSNESIKRDFLSPYFLHDVSPSTYNSVEATSTIKWRKKNF